MTVPFTKQVEFGYLWHVICISAFNGICFGSAVSVLLILATIAYFTLLIVFPPFPHFLCKSSVDFPAKYQDWSATDPIDLFQAPIQKTEANPKVTLALVIYLLFLYEFKCLA